MILSLLVVATGSVACTFGRFTDELQTEKLKQVQQLVDEIENFPDFEEVGGNTIAKTESVLISKYFNSKAPYELVKDFYSRQLTSRGWKLVEEKSLSRWATDYGAKHLTFIKGEQYFSIQYEGNSNVGRDYALGYAWDSPEFRRTRGLPSQ